MSDRPCQPAVDPDILTGDIGSFIAGQIGNQTGDFIGPAITAHRDALAPVVLFRKTVDETGKDVVHPYVLRRELVGKEFREAGKSGTEHTGSRKHRVGLEGGKGGDVEDRPASLIRHDRGNDPARAYDIHQVVVHSPMPVLVGNFQDVTLGTMTRRIYKNINLAISFQRLFNKRLQILRLKIGACVSEAAKLLGKRLAFSRRLQDRDFHAISGKAARSVGAHSGPACCNQGNFCVGHVQLLFGFVPS